MSDIRLYPLSRLTSLAQYSDKAMLVVTEGTGSAADAAEVAAAIGASATPESLVTAAQAMDTTQERDMRAGIGFRLADIRNTQRFVAAKANAWGNTGSPEAVRVLVAGDSLSTGIEPLQNMAVTGFINQFGFTTAGTAFSYQQTSDWVNGLVMNVPVGSTMQLTSFNGTDRSFRCSKIVVGYIAEPGAGSFRIQTLAPQRNSNQWEYVGDVQSTENATKIGKWYEVNVPTTSGTPIYKVRITDVTGKPARIVCVGAHAPNQSGVTWIQGVANLTGRNVAEWAGTPDAIFNPIWAGIKPDCVISRWADAGSEWAAGGAWRTQYARMKAAWPECDFVQIIGNSAYDGPDSGASWPSYYVGQTEYRVSDVAIAQNDTTKLWGRYVCTVAHTQQADRKPGQGAAWTSYWTEYVYDPSVLAAGETGGDEAAKQQELWATETGETFLDVRDVFGPYIQAFTNGLIRDFIHPTNAGWEALMAAMNSRLNLASIPLGGVATGGPYSFGILGGGDARALLNSPLSLVGGINIAASNAGNDSRKAFGVTVLAGGGDTVTATLGVFESIVDIGFAYNGAGQHAVAPFNVNYALGGPNKRWRTWFSNISCGTRTVTSGTSMGYTDHTVYCNASSGAFTVTLPAASIVPGYLYVIKKIDSSANAVTIGGTVDGVTNPTLTAQWQVLRVRSDGTTYYSE